MESIQEWASEYLKKHKQPLAHALGFSIGQRRTTLILIDLFEFLDGFTAELHTEA